MPWPRTVIFQYPFSSHTLMIASSRILSFGYLSLPVVEQLI